MSTFTEKSSLFDVEELATLTSDDDSRFTEGRVTKENIESHDGGSSLIIEVTSLAKRSESFKNRKVDFLSELKFDVEFATRTRFGFGIEDDTEDFGVSRDVEPSESESVLLAIETSVKERFTETIGIRSDQFIPNGDRGFTVDGRVSSFGFGSTGFTFTRNKLDSDIVVRDSRFRRLFEAKTINVGEKLQLLSGSSSSIRTLCEYYMEVKREVWELVGLVKNRGFEQFEESD